MGTEIKVPKIAGVLRLSVGRRQRSWTMPVSIGEPLVEIDPYNMTHEIRAPATGVLAKILVKDGGSVEAGTVVGTIEQVWASKGPGGPKYACKIAPWRSWQLTWALSPKLDRRNYPGCDGHFLLRHARTRTLGSMAKSQTIGLTYAALRKECLDAVRQWPGCETVSGIQILRKNTPGGFSVRVTLYGKADVKIADRAMVCVQREKRRQFHLTEWRATGQPMF
jgi:hypothetical protein